MTGEDKLNRLEQKVVKNDSPAFKTGKKFDILAKKTKQILIQEEAKTEKSDLDLSGENCEQTAK